MDFDSWPKLVCECPYCGEPYCAIYRGYYKRFLLCPVMRFLGPVMIRTGYCKTKKVRFTLFPDFLIRNIRISILGLLAFLSGLKSHNNSVMLAIDECTSKLKEEFYLPISTAYTYLKIKIAAPP